MVKQLDDQALEAVCGGSAGLPQYLSSTAGAGAIDQGYLHVYTGQGVQVTAQGSPVTVPLTSGMLTAAGNV